MFYPIIYVRGYAMSLAEQDETAADPFCGFNSGSTVFRATVDRNLPAKKFIFESPLVRLATDFGYSDVYENGLDISDPDWPQDRGIPSKSVVIYRYYDEASKLLGVGYTPTIEHFAEGLDKLILRVREVVCRDPQNGVTPQTFRCYLVAHSMGGLVCRAFLQNDALGSPEARACVDKFFTYATPHNGIEMAGINVPSWLSLDDISNFNRDKMAGYLALENSPAYNDTDRVDYLPEDMFSSSRVFCMIGTNRNDYEVAKGLSRTFAGHGSDGLVRIENASLWGIDARGNITRPCAAAYTYRSHSGYFGIVNGEESYQNLTRFLFGGLRIDIWLEIDIVTLPPDLQAEEAKGNVIDGLYQFEFTAAIQQRRWLLSRRKSDEDSVACRSHQELMGKDKTDERRRVFLSTTFLHTEKPFSDDGSVTYQVELGVRVPDYEVERKFWPNSHFEGAYLFQDRLAIKIQPPLEPGSDWVIASTWESDDADPYTQRIKDVAETPEVSVPVVRKQAPGIAAALKFKISKWNED